MTIVRLAAAVSLMAVQQALANDDIHYEGQMQAVINGETYTTNGCDKNDEDRCGSCSASLRIISADKIEKVHVSCAIFNEAGKALGVTVNTGFYDGKFTDTTHDNADYGRRVSTHVTLNANDSPENLVQAETNPQKPPRDPTFNYVELNGDHEVISGEFRMELTVAVHNKFVEPEKIIPISGAFNLVASKE